MCGAGSPCIIRDGVVTKFVMLSPTGKASGGLLGEGGQLALTSEDTETLLRRPVVLTCLPDAGR